MQTSHFHKCHWIKLLVIYSFLSCAVYSSTDNRYLTQTTGFKIEYFQWKEHVPYLLPQFNDIFVSEKGPLYHLLLNWNSHNKTRFCLNVNTDGYWGNPEYTSHNYSETLDTILTANSSTQYIGINLEVSLGIELKKIVIGKMVFTLTPNIGIKYCGLKRTIPWANIYVKNSGYIEFSGCDEYWNKFFPTVGGNISYKLSANTKVTMDLNGGFFGYIMERNDVRNSSISHYHFDVHPILTSYFDSKLCINVGYFFIGLTANQVHYDASKSVIVPQLNNKGSYQPESIANSYGLTFGYTLPIFQKNMK